MNQEITKCSFVGKQRRIVRERIANARIFVNLQGWKNYTLMESMPDLSFWINVQITGSCREIRGLIPGFQNGSDAQGLKFPLKTQNWLTSKRSTAEKVLFCNIWIFPGQSKTFLIVPTTTGCVMRTNETMLDALNAGLHMIGHAFVVFRRFPVFILPLLGCWIVYAVIILYLEFGSTGNQI